MSEYGEWHYRNGQPLVNQHGPWRRRDQLARLLGSHCWECFRL